MRKAALTTGATFGLCSHGEKLSRQGGLPASRSCPGATKYPCEQQQTSDRRPRWVKKLCQVHVNRPIKHYS